MARGLSRVRERIGAGEYTEAVAFLGDVLPSEEDFFVVHPDQSSRLLGLKSMVRQLISRLPPEGRSAYELSQATRAPGRVLRYGRELGAEIPRFAAWVEGLGIWGPVVFVAGLAP